MHFNEELVREILLEHGVSLEQITGAKKHKKPIAEQDFIYLLHHFHPPKKAEEMETVHHCIIHEKKGEKGENWEQKHVKDKKVFQHALDIKDIEEAPSVGFDHLNNGFKIKIMKIDKVKHAVIYGLVSIKKTKWSDMDT